MRIGLYLHHPKGGTSRAVSEDPVSGFLLIVRIDRIVTVHVTTLRRGCDRTSTVGYSDVPAYSKVYPRPVGTNRYSSCDSPCRHGAWTISSSLGFTREPCVWPLRIPFSLLE